VKSERKPEKNEKKISCIRASSKAFIFVITAV